MITTQREWVHIAARAADDATRSLYRLEEHEDFGTDRDINDYWWNAFYGNLKAIIKREKK